MSRIMQLSVAKGQQPIRGIKRGSLQPVVASHKEAARKTFGRLLNAELDRIDAPRERGRVSWIYKSLKDKGRPLVSREQVRKWVRGIDIPDQANLRIVCDRLKLDWTRLQTGVVVAGPSPLFLELKAVWDDLSESERQNLVRYAKYIREEADVSTKARPEGPESEGERASLHRHRRA
jgi:hypothetical protein